MDTHYYDSNSTTTGTYWVGTSGSTMAISGLWPSQPSNKKEQRKMRGLYEVYIIDPATDEIIHQTGAIVAKDEDNAQLKAIQIAGGTLLKDIDDYDIIVVELGEVRPKKEVHMVKVIKEQP